MEEETLKKIMENLLKSKKPRAKARNELLEFCSPLTPEVVTILNTSSFVCWKNLVISVLEHDRLEIEYRLETQQGPNYTKIPPVLSTILHHQFENGNYSVLNKSLKHICDNLLSQNVCMISFVGMPYIRILDSAILNNHALRCYLTQEKWNIIFNCICSLLANPPPLLQAEVGQIFLKLLDIGYLYSTLPHYLIFHSLSKTLSSQYDQSFFATSLNAFNIVTERIGYNCRLLVCQKGDEIIKSVLNYYLLSPTSEYLLKFITLQIRFHHPSDLIEADYVTEAWINSVLDLHKILFETFELQKHLFKRKHDAFILDKSEFSHVRELFFTMLTEVIRAYHLITTAFPDTSGKNFDAEPKRLKLSSSNLVEHIVDNLSKYSHPNITTYVQLLGKLLAELPNIFKGKIPEIVQLLFDIFTSSTGESVHIAITEVIQCLITIASNSDLFLETGGTNIFKTNISIHNVHLQKQASYYKLLILLIEAGIEVKLPIIWSAFQHTLCTLDCDSIEFVWKYLSIHDLPSSRGIPNANSTFSSPHIKHTLSRHSTRIFIINHLLPQKIDSLKPFVAWLPTCNHLFMMGQILASQAMGSCRGALNLTEHFFSDSRLRKRIKVRNESTSVDSGRLMLEFEFLPLPPIRTIRDLKLYTSEKCVIQKCNSEYVSYINSSFSTAFTRLACDEFNLGNTSSSLVSLFRYYFYFRLNLVVWSSIYTNSPIPYFHSEFISLVFNQCCVDLMQFTYLDVSSTINNLEAFFTELRSISIDAGSNRLYQHTVFSLITSLLDSIPKKLISTLESRIFKSFESPQNPAPQNLNPLDISILDDSQKNTISFVRILCNIHWLRYTVSHQKYEEIEFFLADILRSNSSNPTAQFIIKRHVLNNICEYFAHSGLVCSEANLLLILEVLNFNFNQSVKLNQIVLNNIMSVLKSLAFQLVNFLQKNMGISHLVETLLRILTSIYLSSRFSSPNRICYIELMFHIFRTFSEIDWSPLTIQSDNLQKPVRELIYEFNLDFERNCILRQAKLLGGLQNMSIDSRLHFSSFSNMIDTIWQSDIPTLSDQHLVPNSLTDSISSDRTRSVLMFHLHIALSCVRKSSFLVARVLEYSVTKSVDHNLIQCVVSRIAEGLSYPNLLSYFEANFESILVEWRGLGNSLCTFPFGILGLNELECVEKYLTKCVNLILLSSDFEAGDYLVNKLPQVESNTDLLKHCFEHDLIILLNSGEQLVSFGLDDQSTWISDSQLSKTREFICQQLPLDVRRILIREKLESTLTNFFLRFIKTCSEKKMKDLKEKLPPRIMLSMDIFCLNDEFKRILDICLFSSFKEDPFLLAKLHVSLLKQLLSTAQPYSFVYNLYCYCTFLQFLCTNPVNCIEIYTFLLNDPVYVLIELLTVECEISIQRDMRNFREIRNNFADSMNHEDTHTLLRTLIILYESNIHHTPQLVLDTLSYLTDILCYYAKSDIDEIATFSLTSLEGLLKILLSENRNIKLIGLCVCIPSDSIFNSLQNLLSNKVMHFFNRFELLQELAMGPWHFQMSCLTYLNQVKLSLKLSIEQKFVTENNSSNLNGMFEKLVQRLHTVSVSSKSLERAKVSELLFEIFVMLTPLFNRRRVTFECANLPVYRKPFKLDPELYHYPILLTRLSKLISCTDLKLKEIAYSTFNLLSGSPSLKDTLKILRKLDNFSTFRITSSYLLFSKSRPDPSLHPSDVSSFSIAFEVPSENSSAATVSWVRQLCIYLLDNYVRDPILIATRALIEIDDVSAEEFLKMYIYDVLLEGHSDKISTISRHINNGLKQAFDHFINLNSSTIQNEISVNEVAIKILLDIALFLRRKVLFDNEYRSFGNTSAHMLEINYLYLACSAFYCKDYHSALLFLEIYRDPLSRHQSTANENLVIPKLLIGSYGELGEIECAKSVVCNSMSLELEKAKLTGNWTEVIQMCNEFPFNTENVEDLSEAMHQLGWHSLLLQQSSDCDAVPASNIHFESTWRLSLWDDNVPDVNFDCCTSLFPQQVIHDSIYAFKKRDMPFLRACTTVNTGCILRDFLCCSEATIFDFAKLTKNIAILRTLHHFSSFSESVLHHNAQSMEFPAYPTMLSSQHSLKDILCIRVSLLLSLVIFLEIDECHDPIYFKSLFKLIINDVIAASKLARKCNQLSEVVTLLHTLESKLQNMTILPPNFMKKLRIQINLEHAKVKFLQQDFQTCFSILKSNLEPAHSLKTHSYLLTLYGNFLGEKQLETSLNVTHYLEKSINFLHQLKTDPSSQVKLFEKAYFSLAQFSDKQYSSIMEYLSSTEYGMKVQLGNSFQQMTKTEKLANEYLQQTCEFERDKINYLKKCFQSYCYCLELSNTHDMSVSRLISLWFDNSENEEMTVLLTDHFRIISTHKFIPWAHQIISRLCSIPAAVTTKFSTTLDHLVIRMACDHPYHCLPILFSIFHSSNDDCTTSDISKSNPSSSSNPPPNNRCRNLLVEIQKVLKGNIFAKMSAFYRDLIKLAFVECAKIKVPVSLPSDCSLLNELSVHSIPIPTIDTPLNSNNDYANVVTIIKFDSKYKIPGGNSKPKLLACLGSDGKYYKMLLKSKDDLRKDAVIQQGFCLINQLLAQDSWFVERNASIRTYKIVPLSQACGLISFYEGAISLSEYLIRKTPSPVGAHQRYYPVDWQSEKCEISMKKARASKDCLKMFRQVCSRFHPVFRFFFFERFVDASTWFERRMQYTRSVALTSMAGYIFGIGDRHTENILVDVTTAEIVHIDFGILFDYGKHLPVPELVPFRLTRDIVDPMGSLGMDGVFRPCCEEMLRIIRHSKQEIKTIMKLLLHTPLHEWKIIQNCIKDNLRKQSSQQGNLPSNITNFPVLSEDINELALRVLLRINEKIDGIEGRTPLSISGQVNRLIAEATDEEKLCLMFPGWKPWV